MTVKEIVFTVKTSQELDIKDITPQVKKSVKKSGIKEGIVLVFVPGATGAVTTIEYEPGLLEDFPRALEKLFPKNIRYEHHERWHDGNGHSHVRASFLGPSLTVPLSNGELTLGTWQQIILCDMDVPARERKIIVKVIGE
ncbi:MAG: secondary thiamine-phosphate synthase enzyme YjbQ [Thermoplasmata archaeon]